MKVIDNVLNVKEVRHELVFEKRQAEIHSWHNARLTRNNSHLYGLYIERRLYFDVPIYFLVFSPHANPEPILWHGSCASDIRDFADGAYSNLKCVALDVNVHDPSMPRPEPSRYADNIDPTPSMRQETQSYKQHSNETTRKLRGEWAKYPVPRLCNEWGSLYLVYSQHEGRLINSRDSQHLRQIVASSLIPVRSRG